MVARLGDGAMMRGKSRLNIREGLPRREVLFGRGKKRPMVDRLKNILWVVDAIHGRSQRRPTVGFILPLLKGLMIGIGWEERKVGEAPEESPDSSGYFSP